MKGLLISILSVSLALVGCGKDSGSSSGPQERPSGLMKGVAFDGLITGGKISILDMSGNEIAAGTTDESGSYSISLDSIASQPLKITVTDGQYKEEYSGKSVQLQDKDALTALVNYRQGEDIDVSLTYYTTISAGLAEYRIKSGADTAEAINVANTAISEVIGIDIVDTIPKDITDSLNVSPSLEEDQVYGYLTASISAYTAWISETNGAKQHDPYNSISFAQKAYNDISNDGKLDGIGADGNIAMGKVLFSPDTYRNTLAINMLVMANSENNRLGYSAADLVSYAKKLNDSASSIFADAPLIALNADGTIFGNLSWTEGEAFYGVVTLTVSAFDVVGIKSAKLTINGVDFAADNLEPLTFTFDSAQFADGAYETDIAVTNNVDIVTHHTQKITFANRATAIVSTNPVEGQAIGGEYEFSAVIADPFGIDSVKFVLDDSIEISPTDPSTPTARVNTKTTIATEGQHTFEVMAVGLSGFEVSKKIDFVVDNTAPSVTLNLGEGAYVSSTYTLSGNINDNLDIKSAAVLIDGTELGSVTQKGSYSVSFDPQNYAEGQHTVVIDAFDKAGNRTTVNRTFFVDRNPPTINITTPSSVVVTGNTEIYFEAADTLGFGSNNFVARLKGYPIDLEVISNSKRSFTLKPGTLFWGEGNATVEITVTDGSGKTATDSIIVNFQHIPTWLVLGASSTDSDTFRTQVFTFAGASGRQTINSIKFNGVEVTQNSINDPLVPWTPNKPLDPTHQFSLITWLMTKPHSCETVGTLTYTITDEYGVQSNGTVNNFAWCNNTEYTTATAWAFLQAW